MPSNLDRFRSDLDSLVQRGNQLWMAIQYETYPEEFAKLARKKLGKQTSTWLEGLPSFKDKYQAWYSEAKSIVKQLLPDRLSDFARLYEKPSPRKNISYENYRIEDCLQDLTVTRGFEKVQVVGPGAAIALVRQQLAILVAAQARFESSLFEIRQLVQADLLDSELDAARLLAKRGFARAAGAVAGVVLERSLAQVCVNHNVPLKKKSPNISDINDALKAADVYDVPQWRYVQHLADLRNLCDHDRKRDPTTDEVNDLISGVTKVTKTVY
jgi:hypothetical protein